MSDLNDFLSPAALWVPDHLPASAWIEHAPFAFWLVDALRPRRLVELGVGHGFSYLCFCQAIDRLRLDAQATGVDPWAGEDATFHEVSALNRRFEAFSTLVRDTEEVARGAVAPGSVDLLHIDLGGEPAATAAALEDWRLLLAEDGVLLLHGVNPDQDGGGTYRLFDDLRSRVPSLHFAAGRGLGLVVPGGVVPVALRPLLKASASERDAALKMFAALGEGLRARRRALANQDSLRRLLQEPDGRPDLDPDADREVAQLRAKLSDAAARSLEFKRLETRLAALETSGPGGFTRRGPRAQGDAASAQARARLSAERAPGGPSQADLDRLNAKLREARSSEAAAHRFARAARRAIRARHGELAHQTVAIEAAAAAARADVLRLAADAAHLGEDEHRALVERETAQHHLQELLRQEQEALRPRQDLKHVLSLGAARRWRHRARTYAPFVSRIEEAATRIRAAQDRLELAKQARHQAEQLAAAAEPRASELASAAMVMRGELNAAEEILATLPADLGEDADVQTDDYARWVDLYDTITEPDRRAIRARLLRMPYQPLISVVMPVYNTPGDFLRQAIASVQAQLYTNWELCIADDASPDPQVFALLQELALADPRIKVVRRDTNGHISAASNSALALATGEFVALMDHDDVLPEHALFEVVACLNENRELDLIYSDEDHVDQHGTRSNAYFKPDFNLDLLLGHNLISHFGVYRRSLLEEIGGFRLGFEGSQDYDLALRTVDATTPDRIHHIPAVLYHWRSNTGDATFSESAMQRCIDTARQALVDHLERRGQAGDVVSHPRLPTWQLVRRKVPEPAPLVTVIIPTKDKAEILEPCVEGVLNRTRYANLEVLIVDHQSTDPAAVRLLARLAEDPRVEVMSYEGPFNYAAINNTAVARARGSVLALLNNDVDVIDPDWLDEMVSLAVLPEVGAVGAKLLYPDGRIQHAGVILGTGGVAATTSSARRRARRLFRTRRVARRRVAAVTAACLVIRRSVFEEVGGFDEVNLPVAFNDVDLCLKIGEAGYRNVWTPEARLYHHESISRGSDQVGERLERFNREVEFMLQKWQGSLDDDPFYNPNLNLSTADFSLAYPPRRRRPWRTVESG